MNVQMDCCTGFVVRFHTEFQLGFNIIVMARFYTEMQSGDFDLKGLPSNLEVRAYASGEEFPDTWYSGGLLLNRLPEVGVQGFPFVVTVDSERIYMGAFFTMVSSFSFEGCTIIVEEITDNYFTFHESYPPGTGEVCADSRILNVLEEAGKLAH